MLVLSRKVNESIEAEGIVVTILGIRGGKVRVGIQAPPHVTILRSEIVDRDTVFEVVTDEG